MYAPNDVVSIPVDNGKIALWKPNSEPKMLVSQDVYVKTMKGIGYTAAITVDGKYHALQDGRFIDLTTKIIDTLARPPEEINFTGAPYTSHSVLHVREDGLLWSFGKPDLSKIESPETIIATFPLFNDVIVITETSVYVTDIYAMSAKMKPLVCRDKYDRLTGTFYPPNPIVALEGCGNTFVALCEDGRVFHGFRGKHYDEEDVYGHTVEELKFHRPIVQVTYGHANHLGFLDTNGNIYRKCKDDKNPIRYNRQNAEKIFNNFFMFLVSYGNLLECFNSIYKRDARRCIIADVEKITRESIGMSESHRPKIMRRIDEASTTIRFESRIVDIIMCFTGALVFLEDGTAEEILFEDEAIGDGTTRRRLIQTSRKVTFFDEHRIGFFQEPLVKSARFR